MTTLLTYAILPAPNPLGVAGNATLTLAVSNGGTQIVTVASITMTIPVGTNAKDLMTVTTVATQPPDGWTIAQDGGAFTLTPATASAAEVGADGLAFTFASIVVNGEPGTSTVAIVEAASSPSQPSANRTASVPLAKFPAAFALSDLTGPATTVAQGGSASLMWTGSPATYVLTYDPDGNGGQSFSVGASGPFSAHDLTAPVVVFTLAATVTVPGQDQPLKTQRQVVVTVTAVTFDFTALPTSVGTNGVAKLAWTTTGVQSCTVNPGVSTALNGSAYVIVPATQTFSLIMTESGTGKVGEQQVTVTVDPAIVPTSTLAFVGQNGRDGSPGGSSVFDQDPRARDGGNGSTGGPANPGGGPQTIEFGPLDLSSTPSIVVQVINAGGNGGRGGDGAREDQFVHTQVGNGGNGGDGGDAAVLTFQMGALSKPQALIVVNRGGGQGGAGGLAGGAQARSGTAGTNGKPGSITFVDVT